MDIIPVKRRRHKVGTPARHKTRDQDCELLCEKYLSTKHDLWTFFCTIEYCWLSILWFGSFFLKFNFRSFSFYFYTLFWALSLLKTHLLDYNQRDLEWRRSQSSPHCPVHWGHAKPTCPLLAVNKYLFNGIHFSGHVEDQTIIMFSVHNSVLFYLSWQ